MANMVLSGTNLECLRKIPLKSVSGSKFPTLRDIFDSNNLFSAEGLWMMKSELFLSQEETSTPLDLEFQNIANCTQNHSYSHYRPDADSTSQAPPQVLSPHI